MNNRNIIESAIKLLKIHYYGNIILLAIFFLLLLFGLIPLFVDSRAVNITLERYVIMITIIVIPVALKFFASRLKKAVLPMEAAIAATKYKNIYFVRLYTIGVVTLMQIILFALSRNMNFFWFTVVLFIIFIFCKPSYEELESLTKEAPKNNPEEVVEEPLNENTNSSVQTKHNDQDDE